MSMSDYVMRIDILLFKMFALWLLVLPANQNRVEKYLYHVWMAVTMLTGAFYQVDVDERLLHNFDDFTQVEERLLWENLQAVKYTINTMVMGSRSPCPQKRTRGLHKSAPDTLRPVRPTNPDPSRGRHLDTAPIWCVMSRSRSVQIPSRQE